MRERTANTGEPYDGEFGAMYEVRLGDTRAWHVVRARCPRCGHDGPVSMDRMLARGDSHTRLIAAEQWLRCSRCGNRVGNSIFLIKLPRN
jgi:DNA-directed RNA polymerase subunit RPC12/RpoP